MKEKGRGRAQFDVFAWVEKKEREQGRREEREMFYRFVEMVPNYCGEIWAVITEGERLGGGGE